MKPIRTGLAAAAVAALMIVPATAAHAATTTVVVTPDDLKGWAVSGAPFDTTFAFTAGPSTTGTGSVQFGPIAAAPAQSKFIIGRAGAIGVDSLGGISYDFYIDPTAANKDPKQYYLNVYVDSAHNAAAPTNFYECRYDYVPTAGTSGWNTFSITPATVATQVPAARDGATCGDSLDDLPDGSTILLFALNGGDTNPNDAGLKGGFDTVRVTGGGNTTVYDFEPAAVTACDTAPSPGRLGTAGADTVRGTAGADRIDLLAGNDTVDSLGGDDCVLGGSGRDAVRTGDGNDEILGGPDADTVDAGAGADLIDPGPGADVVAAGAGNDTLTLTDGAMDVVDCGAGTDTAVADRADLLRNCESVTRA